MILPKPWQLSRHDGAFRVTPATKIHVAVPEAAAAGRALRRAWGLGEAPSQAGDDQASATTQTSDVVVLSVEGSDLGPEEYALTVTPERIEITGGDPAGAFYGVQSLRQLLPAESFDVNAVPPAGWDVPAVSIADRPSFRWRGAMLDVARHFMPTEFVLELVDLLALHKLNVLHLHLTDDQGWRLPVPKYPDLTNVGAWRRETLVGSVRRPEAEYTFDGKPHGGFYSTVDLREIVSYAAERFVTVVPEIDMPGHMLAAIAAYPQLGNGLRPATVWTQWGVSEQVLNVEEETLGFCRDVLDEVMRVFPSTLVHCGGDECPKEEWKASPAVQARIQELGVANEHALQAWFTAEIAAYLTEKGRRFVGWDEVLEGRGLAGLPADVVVMSWRGEEGGIEAARAGLDVVMAPHTDLYFDYYQDDPEREPLAQNGVLPLTRVYDYHPIPDELDATAASHVLGAQCQLWTEYVPTTEQAQYMLFPRLCAFAETVWRDEASGIDDFDTFVRDRLRPNLARLDALGVGYRALD